MKKYIPIFIAGILVLSGLGAVAISDDNETNTIIESANFSEPIIKENGQYVTVDVNEATSYLMETGNPALSVVTRIYTFPFGTQIENVEVTFSESYEQVISKDIMPAAEPQYISTELVTQADSKELKRSEVYESEDIYPENRVSYRIGSGLDSGEHCVYLSIHYCPITYSPLKNTIYVSDSANIEISYKPASNPTTFLDEYDLLILTIPEFEDALQPLVDYKNDHDIQTIVVTLDEIPSQGVDVQEDIKYYIKDAIEQWDITYVLIVGAGVKDEEIFPVRYAWIPSGGYEQNFPSDLYYADIYDGEGNFSTWDNNSNGKYCEYPADLDAVDIYPDVYLGRLPCNDVVEVEVVVNKIINFMEHNQVTERIVQIGGDTFPGDDEHINEGEYANEKVLEKLPGYSSIQCWASTNKLTKFQIIRGIHKGADFVDFSGHGSPVSWATHPTEDDSVWIPKGIKYTGWLYIHCDLLFNSKKHPVVVLNACSTSKFSQTASCLSWYFVSKPRAGAIATYGASGIGYGSHGSSETERLFGWMEVHLHEEFYRNGVLGAAWGNCITNYTNNFEMEDADYKTVVEMSLFGDPSLALVTGPDPESVPVVPIPPLFQLLENLMEWFPRAFPILRYLFGF